ncbi:MAG: dockerin type I domain-containing protein [Gammaproteobacteria bacterium]|nr:dockerin type I domain-containing protein [Gammaproteobacteria bacterium]
MITPTPHILVFSLLILNPLLVSASEGSSCVKAGSPMISAADFDSNGTVDGRDIAILARHVDMRKKNRHSSKKDKAYYALYDINADGELDKKDLMLAKRDIGNRSTKVDQEIATIYTRFKDLQTVRGYETLTRMGYSAIPVALKGHGVHWFSPKGMASLMGQSQPSIYSAEGLNVSTDEKRIHALFWAAPATPVFANGATDYPHGDSWKDSRVIAFDNMPKKLTSSVDEDWHKHGGLCMPLNVVTDSDGNETVAGEAHQFTTYNECQAIPSNASMMPDGSNLWANFWMVHMWLFDINANGFFAGTHPCVEPDAAADETIAGDREVPPFFADHGDMAMDM